MRRQEDGLSHNVTLIVDIITRYLISLCAIVDVLIDEKKTKYMLPSKNCVSLKPLGCGSFNVVNNNSSSERNRSITLASPFEWMANEEHATTKL